MNPDTLSTAQAARVLGLSARRVIQLADEGKLTCDRTPLGRLFAVAEVERLRAEREGAAA